VKCALQAFTTEDAEFGVATQLGRNDRFTLDGIRRHLLERYEASPIKVFDIMNGVGHVIRPVHQLSFEAPIIAERTRKLTSKVEFRPLRGISAPLLRAISCIGSEPRILQDSAERGSREIEASDIGVANSQTRQNPERLRIAFEAVRDSRRHELIKLILRNVPERWMSQIVGKTSSFDDIGIEAAQALNAFAVRIGDQQSLSQASTNLRDFERVGETVMDRVTI
jgi:hypothetical protein